MPHTGNARMLSETAAFAPRAYAPPAVGGLQGGSRERCLTVGREAQAVQKRPLCWARCHHSCIAPGQSRVHTGVRDGPGLLLQHLRTVLSACRDLPCARAVPAPPFGVALEGGGGLPWRWVQLNAVVLLAKGGACACGARAVPSCCGARSSGPVGVGGMASAQRVSLRLGRDRPMPCPDASGSHRAPRRETPCESVLHERLRKPEGNAEGERGAWLVGLRSIGRYGAGRPTALRTVLRCHNAQVMTFLGGPRRTDLVLGGLSKGPVSAALFGG